MNLDLGDTRLILTHCQRHGLLRNQAAYVLATAFWETARTMTPVEEAYYLGSRAEAHRRTLRYYPWHGRGYVQLTWEANYLKAGKAIGVDLITDPDAAMVAANAAPILVIGMRDGWFTGKRLADYITLRASDFRGARRVVNGTDRRDEIAAIARDYDAALLVEGYGVAPSPQPVPPIAAPSGGFWAWLFDIIFGKDSRK